MFSNILYKKAYKKGLEEMYEKFYKKLFLVKENSLINNDEKVKIYENFY